MLQPTYLEGHPSDFQRRFLQTFDWNELAAYPKYNDLRIGHLGHVLTDQPPVMPNRGRPHNACDQLLTLGTKDIPNELLLSRRCVLIHSIDRPTQFLFDKL
jgi:hypothetical protein